MIAITRTLAEIKNDADIVCNDYNAAVRKDDVASAAKLKSQLDNFVGEYTATAQEICFKELESAENPMIEAVRRLNFESICVRSKKSTKSTIATSSVEFCEHPINLLKLHSRVPDGIGANHDWANILQKFNMLMTVQAASNLGAESDAVRIAKAFRISDIARDFDLGETPTSNTKLLKMLQTSIEAMIGSDYKASTHDVQFLKDAFTKKGRKALTIETASHTMFIRIVMEICHKILAEKGYCAASREVKKD